MTRGIFFLVAGPAGVGKTTLLQQLVAQERGLCKAISVTTRPPRAGEKDGEAYFFWDEQRFLAAVQRGEFLEHAVVHGRHYYGTLAKFVEEKLDAGIDVVKDIDVQGVDLIRKLDGYQYPRTVSIFVMPPSDDELLKRLKGRATEGSEEFNQRLATAEAELARANEYDYIVVNDIISGAVDRLKEIRQAEHARR